MIILTMFAVLLFLLSINKQDAIGITDWTNVWGTHSSVTNVSPVINVKTK